MVELTLAQAKAIVAMFGGDEEPEATITVRAGKIGHSGPGLYAWFTEYPDEGSFFLPEQDDATAEFESWMQTLRTRGVPASGLTEQLQRAVGSSDEGHDPLCMAVLRGKECTCGVPPSDGRQHG